MGKIPGIRYSEHYFPYTLAMMIALLKDFDIIDKTDMYAQEKLAILTILVVNLRALSSGFCKLLGYLRSHWELQRLSVLIFVCRKNLS